MLEQDIRRRIRFERAISFTAALIEHLLDLQYIVSFRAFGPDPMHLRIERRHGAMDELLYALATLRSSRLYNLGDLLEKTELRDNEVYFALTLSSSEARDTRLPRNSILLTPGDMRAMITYEPRALPPPEEMAS